MLGRFNQMALVTQFRLLAAAVLALGALTAFLLMGQAYIANAQGRARAVADLVEDVGVWASSYRGLWVRSDSADPAKIGESLATVPLFSPDARPLEKPAWQSISRTDLTDSDLKTLDGVAGGFHMKNPELVQRELAEIANASGQGVKFRIASDKIMNPANAPTRFELAAIESIRESGNVEVSEVRGDTLLYARRLKVAPTCMACHDSPATAPAGVRSHYPSKEHGYGFKVGEVVGVLSVSVPVVQGGGSVFGAIGAAAWVGVVAFVASIAALLWFMQRVVIAPVQRLSRSTFQASESDIESLHAADLQFANEGSHNDVHRLDVAIKRLLRSLRAQRRY